MTFGAGILRNGTAHLNRSCVHSRRTMRMATVCLPPAHGGQWPAGPCRPEAPSCPGAAGSDTEEEKSASKRRRSHVGDGVSGSPVPEDVSLRSFRPPPAGSLDGKPPLQPGHRLPTRVFVVCFCRPRDRRVLARNGCKEENLRGFLWHTATLYPREKQGPRRLHHVTGVS